MKTLKRLMMLVAIAAAFARPAFALTEKVGDYTWTYTVSSWTNDAGTVFSYAILGDGTNACVSPSPKGGIELPRKLGGTMLTEVSANAFKGCAGLTDVQIAENIEWIEPDAFNGATALKHISVVRYNEWYFSVDGVLYEGEWGEATIVRVPEAYEAERFVGLMKPRVYGAYADAFRDCTKIKTVVVDGASMWAAAEVTFEGCSAFEAFEWEYGHDAECDIYPYVRDGVLYDYDSGELLRWPTAKPFTGIPAGAYVSDLAFAGNMTVTNLTLEVETLPCADSLELEVSARAFVGCANLKTVVCKSADGGYGLIWDLEASKDEIGVQLEKVVYPWQPILAEEWEGYDYLDSTGGVVHVSGFIKDFKDEFPGSKVVFEKATDPNLGTTNLTFPYTTRYIDLGSYDFEVYADTLTTLTFEGPAAEGLWDVLDVCTNVTKIVYSANPIYRDHDGDEWISWTNVVDWVAQDFTNRVFTFEQGAVPAEPQFYGDCGELRAFVGDDEVVFPCVWPAPKGELVIPDDIYCIEGEAFKGLTGVTSLTLPSWVEIDEEAIDSLSACMNLAEINMPRPKDHEDIWYEYYSLDGILYDSEGGVVKVPPAWAGTNFELRSWAWENALAGCRNIQTLTVYDPEALYELNLSGCSKLTAFVDKRGGYCSENLWEYHRIVDGALYEVYDEDYGLLSLVCWPPAKKPIKLAEGTVEVYSEAFRNVINPQSVTEFEVPVVDYGSGEIENCYVDLWELASSKEDGGCGFTGIRKIVYQGYPSIDSSILKVLPNLQEIVYPTHPRYAADWADTIADFKAVESSVTFTVRDQSEPEYVYELDVWDEDDYGNILYGDCWLGNGEWPYAWPALKGAHEIPAKIKNCWVVGAYENSFADMTELTELTFPWSFREFFASSRSRIVGSMIDTNGVTNASVSISFNWRKGFADVSIAATTGDLLYGGIWFSQSEEGADIVLDGTVSYDGLLHVRVSTDGKMAGTLSFPSDTEYEIAAAEQTWVSETDSPFIGCTNLEKLTFSGFCPEGLFEVLEFTPSIKEVVYPGVPWYGWAEFIAEFAAAHPDSGVTFTQLPYDEEDGLYWNISEWGEDYDDLSSSGWEDADGSWHIVPGVWPSPVGEVAVPDRVGVIGENVFYGCSDITSLVFPDTLGYLEVWDDTPGYWDETNNVWVATGDPSIVSPFTGCTKLAKLTFNGWCPEGLWDLLVFTPSIREVVYPAAPWYGWAEFIEEFKAEYPDATVTFTQAGEPTEPTFRYELEAWDEDEQGNVLDGECWLGDGEYPYAWPLLKGAYEVPEKIANCRVVGAYANAFANMTELTELIFPASFYELDAGSYQSGNGMHPEPYRGQGLISAEQTNGGDTGDDTVFYSPFTGCTGLAKLTFRGALPSGLGEALERTPSIKEVVYPGMPWCLAEWEEFIEDFTSNHVGAVTFTQMSAPDDPLWNIEWEYEGYEGYLNGEVWEEENDDGSSTRKGIPGVWPVPASGELVVPEGVVEIGEGAFFGCAGVTRLVLPNTVGWIDEMVFADLPDLQEIVVMPQTEDGAVDYCGDRLGGYYFTDENGLLYNIEGELVCCPAGKAGSVTVSGWCWYVSETAFVGCTNVTEIVLPAWVEEVGYEAFAPCTALESISICGSTQIGNAFAPEQRITMTIRPAAWESDGEESAVVDGFVDESLNCSGAEWLAALKVEEGVWGIEEGAFGTCPNLAVAELPESLLWLGSEVFASCTNLTAVYYNGNAPYGCEGLYMDAASELVSYVKAGTTGWNGYEGLAGLPSPAVWPVCSWNDELNAPDDKAARAVQYGTAAVEYYVDGELFKEDAIPVGTAPSALEAEKEGHTFGGWFSDSELTSVADFTTILKEFGSSISFYGTFTANTYTLSFDSAGGSDVDAITQDYGTAVTAPAAPTRIGYTFIGWDPEVPATMPAGDATYTAQWTANGYTVAFDANGGEGAMAVQTNNYDLVSCLTSNAFTRIGHTFAGWATNETGEVLLADGAAVSNLTAAANGNVKFFAVWSVNQYTLTFDAAGGSEVAPVTQDYGTALAAPTVTRTGYTFEGWDPEVPATMPAGDATYTAQWTANGYTVAFDANGGEGAMAVQTNNYDLVSCLTSNAFTRIGHTFAGWATNETGEVLLADGAAVSNLTAAANGNVKFFAVWSVNQYTLTFDAAGGSEVAPVTQDYGTVLAAPTVTRTGYTFEGWDPEVPATMPAGDATYTAQWKINTYTVAFDANGGTCERKATNVDYGAAYGEPPEPTRNGWIFEGWFTSVDGGTQITGDSKLTADSDVTLYAHWREISLHGDETVEETPAPASASEYNGFLVDEKSGAVVGTIQVKVGAPNKKTGLATVSATVQIGAGKKKTLKGAEKGKTVIASDGPTDITFVGGEACVVTLGEYGMSGNYGDYTIDGSRNVFTSKNKSEASAAAKAIEKWVGAYVVMWDGGTASVTIDKKGKAQASVTLSSGTKGTATSQLLIGEEWLCVPVVVTKKVNVVFNLWLPAGGGEIVVTGLGDDVVVGKTGAIKAGAKFRLDTGDAFWAKVSPDLMVKYLPNDVAVTQKGSKLTLPKAGKLSVKKGVLDDSKAGENPSGLKLTLKKDGTFTGTFKAYYIAGGKLKTVTVNVSGIVINGAGYGTAAVKNVGSVPISIE